jgi:signal transduction histidine kinase
MRTQCSQYDRSDEAKSLDWGLSQSKSRRHNLGNALQSGRWDRVIPYDFRRMKALRDRSAKSAALASQPSSRSWLEGGVAVLDADARIVAASAPLANWLGVEAAGLVDQKFATVLCSQFPEWESPLRESLSNSETFIQVALITTSTQPREWFNLELARSTSGCYARLSSVLPPRPELSEGAWNEFLGSESAQRSMFVRLMLAEARLDNLVQRWPGVIFSQRPDFTFQFVSPKITELTGVPLGEWGRSRQRFWQVVHEADQEILKQHLQRANQAPNGVSCNYRIRHFQSGQVAYLMEHRQAVRSHNGLLLGYEGFWLDVSRQTIAEKRLSSAAWKETLGVLTMGLAHDFSNIMAGIHSLSESFLAQVNDQHPFYEGLGLIRQQSMHASQLVHRIVELHHGKTGERNYRDLNEFMNDLVDLARKLLPRRVEVATELSSEALPVYVDGVEFRQVILNLTLNAADAMPNGGKLIYRTSLHHEAPPVCQLSGPLPRLPIVCLSVQDTGCGIPTRNLASIFDPFFTTKPMNKGSGLGLYNARLFIEKHQGAIWVESSVGVGTTFYLWLPQADFSEAERALTTAAGQRRCLLLAGPAGESLNATAEFLRVNGYFVVACHSARQATEMLASAEYHFGGLFLLPDPNSATLTSLIKDARHRYPGLKILFYGLGCNQDELDSRLLQQTDLVISPDLSEEDILAKLKELLAGNDHTS